MSRKGQQKKALQEEIDKLSQELGLTEEAKK
jgi:hypothetical protein